MSLFLALGLICAAPLLGQVPIAALVGVMLLVCQSTFSWSSLRLAGRVPKTDLFCIALVSIVTVTRDLAQAVGVGTVVSALSFAWRQSTNIRVRAASGEEGKPGWRTYQIDGPLFFGSTQTFNGQFSPKDDPDDVVLDFAQSRVMDHSALVINLLCERYGGLGKRVRRASRPTATDCSNASTASCRRTN